VNLQALAANTGLATLISGTTLPVATIRSLKAGWLVRLKAWPARCVVGEWSESASLYSITSAIVDNPANTLE